MIRQQHAVDSNKAAVCGISKGPPALSMWGPYFRIIIKLP